jgi:Ran-binding protein 9/10
MPGWDDTAWGYHGDDGDKYHDSQWGVKYAGQTFKTDDIVGCFLDLEKKELSYTKNGESLGT